MINLQFSVVGENGAILTSFFNVNFISNYVTL